MSEAAIRPDPWRGDTRRKPASTLTLTGRQRALLDLIVRHYRATGEPCSASYLARRLDIHHSTVQEHMSALYRKGWLRSPNAPAIPSRTT